MDAEKLQECARLCPGDLGDNPLDINTFLICHSYFQ